MWGSNLYGVYEVEIKRGLGNDSECHQRDSHDE